MRRAAAAFVVTVLVVVAGIWLREQGPPLDGVEPAWQTRDRLLSGVDEVLASGARHSVVQPESGRPVLLDRKDGSAVRLPGSTVLGVSDAGRTVTETDGQLYGTDAGGRTTWRKRAGRLVEDPDPRYLGSDGSVVAIAGCPDDEGVVLGLSIADGEEQWRVDGPCAVEQPDAGVPGKPDRYFVTVTEARAFKDGSAVDVRVHEISDGRRVAEFRRVRAAHLVGLDLLVLDGDHQLSAHQGSESRWLLDPETAALADSPASGLDGGYAGTPVVTFADESALVDASSGTLRRAKAWSAGPLAREAVAGAVAFGREHLWDDDELVVRNVFTGRELWRAELPAGKATADVADPGVITVAVERTSGRHQVFAYDALTGRRLARTTPTVEPWQLLPAGPGELLASSGRWHYLLVTG